MVTPLELLNAWIQRDCEGDIAWLQAQCTALRGPETRTRTLYTAIGLAPRKLGKVDCQITDADRQAADAAIPGWDPTGYSVDMAARLVLVLTAYDGTEDFFETFDTLWRTADVGEQVAFYRGLPLYPDSHKFLWRATDGCRTNIKAVFEGIAHRNPYPAAHFDEVAFNQLCLKALFVGSSLHHIQNLDSRHNPALARMMTDYAFERWAASRNVSPELWRCVAPCPDARCLEALSKALKSEDLLTRYAAALACSGTESSEAQHLLSEHPDLVEEVQSGRISWPQLASDFAS